MLSIARELNGITGSFFMGKEREGHWVGSKGRKDYSSSGPIQELLSEVAKGLQRVQHMLISWRERAGLISQMARDERCVPVMKL